MRGDDEYDEVAVSAYAYAIALLDKGIQPYCINYDDELHVIGCKPTDRASLAQMSNPDGDIRDGYMACAMCMIRDMLENSAFA